MGGRGNLIDVRGPAKLGGEGLARFEADQSAGYLSRFLTVNGTRAYEAGNGCETCEFWFTRLEGANDNITIEPARAALADGVATLDDPVVGRFAQVLAEGPYLTLLRDVVPKLVDPVDPAGYFRNEQVELWGIDGFWGLPHDPRVPYHRLPDTPIDDAATLFEFVVPMYPPTWLDAETVAAHTARLDQASPPTVVTLSVLDVKQPANWDDGVRVTEHWCLAHYLLDGHHKAAAAAAAGRPIRMLTYLAVDEGVSSPGDIAKVQRLLRST